MSQYIYTLAIYVILLMASKLSFILYKKIRSKEFKTQRLLLAKQWKDFMSDLKMFINSLFNDIIKFP